MIEVAKGVDAASPERREFISGCVRRSQLNRRQLAGDSSSSSCWNENAKGPKRIWGHSRGAIGWWRTHSHANRCQVRSDPINRICAEAGSAGGADHERPLAIHEKERAVADKLQVLVGSEQLKRGRLTQHLNID